MKTSFAAIVVALASVATAQLSDVPSCALNCFVSALSSDGCSSLTDFTCHCKKTSLIPTVEPCVQKACSPDDQAKVITAVEGTCSSAGVPISIPTSGLSAASSVAASSVAASSAPASSAVATTEAASSSVAVVTSSAAAVSTVTSLVGTGTIISSNASTVASATLSSFTGGAAQATQAVGFIGAAALALAAAL